MHAKPLAFKKLGAALCLALGPAAGVEANSAALEATRGSRLQIRRAAGPIEIDGKLDDAGWQGALRVDDWFETNPGDNVKPGVENVAWLAYDDKFFYAGFDFHDPEPSAIRAPLGDRDNVPSSTDYAGVILDTRNDGHSAMMFLANARGIQYDAITDDAGNGEDSAPDFFWDARGRITDRGWTLEIRIPFSSLRYAKADPQTWGVLLYRNRPREYRYQMFSTKLPRGSNCFICRANWLEGLESLPRSGGLVLAPYATGVRRSLAEGGLGWPLVGQGAEGEVGLDVKWVPSANFAFDATVNPDFSQIEADVAQIATNERFALFFPEKRPFFLEGTELFQTPLQAFYTRSITAPRFGVRGTGKLGAAAFSAVFAEDEGGGSVILPGPVVSDLAAQDFKSWVAATRVKRDIGRSHVAVLATLREAEGGGHNRVIGPDFQWRPNQSDIVTGQFLYSDSRTPNRPDLAAEWDGRSLSGHAAQLWYQHSSSTWDWYGQLTDASPEFRADNGFISQVGHRQTFGEVGRTFRPETGFVRRLRTFTFADRVTDRDGELVQRHASAGFGFDGRFASFVRLRYAFDRTRAGRELLDRNQFIYSLQVSPSRTVTQVNVDGFVGGEIDFANERAGTGGNVNLSASIRPTAHLELALTERRRWLDVDDPVRGSGRLFTARVDRLRATYTFTSRMFLRLIGQYVETRNDPALWTFDVPHKSGGFQASGLFAYKLNWQTVLFVGFGDNRALDEQEKLQRADRQFFVKLSYAFQR
ncbi:MAG: carbohydrate binding family 9 domain-containing protein [Vicinamibacteria bacterium]|nr:carbohydrate binding family 9 domain-containing protein [Vicinamibacteria bacterium]